VISFVNPSATADVDVDCSLRGVTARAGRAQILHHMDLNAYNSFDKPDVLVPKAHEIAVEGTRVRLTAPALSIITATVQV